MSHAPRFSLVIAASAEARLSHAEHVIDGVADLVYEQADGVLTVVDVYRRQVQIYAAGAGEATGQPVRAVLFLL